MSAGKKTTVELAEEIASELIEQMGLTLWDITFAKEGSVWTLCYLLDKEGGIGITDCEEFSRGVDKLLDEADPIPQSYTLEVSSPGIERELTRPRHYEECMGQAVTVRLIRPLDGVKDFVGTLCGYDGVQVTIASEDDEKMTIKLSDAAYVRLYYEF
ncbi:MAG: ribosome maturation factor RimP [Angelakisella sp.]